MVLSGNVKNIKVTFWYSSQKYRYARKFIQRFQHLLQPCMITQLVSSYCHTRKPPSANFIRHTVLSPMIADIKFQILFFNIIQLRFYVSSNHSQHSILSPLFHQVSAYIQCYIRQFLTFNIRSCGFFQLHLTFTLSSYDSGTSILDTL